MRERGRGEGGRGVVSDLECGTSICELSADKWNLSKMVSQLTLTLIVGLTKGNYDDKSMKSILPKLIV